MIGESEALMVIREKVRRGAYGEVANYLESLPPAIKTAPLIVLEQSRAFLRQGKPIDAESALATANLNRATPGERLILTMETASLQIYRRIAIREALETAKVAFATAEGTLINPVDWAEAERVHIRILLTAAVYYEIPPDEKRTARDRLLVIAETLEQAGHLDESLAARFSYAEYLDDLNQRVDALSNLADYAATVDRPALAGEAQRVRAEQMLAAGAASDAIRAVLDMAVFLYTQVDHVHGLIDVQLVRAKLAVERELATPEALEACLTAYQRIDFPKGILNVLMDLSQLAHDQGDTRTAAIYRQQMIDLAETVGMGLAKDSFQTAQIDLLMRNNDYGEAIERCQAAVNSTIPVFSKAGYEQLLATAYSFINNLDEACNHGYQAIQMFEAKGAVDAASDSVTLVASNLSSFHRDEKWQEAEDLLREWVTRDEQREDFDAAINKHEVIAKLKIERFLYSPVQKGQVSLLDEAEQEIQAAEALTTHLSSRDAAKRLGSLYQLRGQIYQGRGDENGVIQTWRNALAVYDQAGLSMNVANCHYILGAIYLNRANQDLMANFGEAEDDFREALTYYDDAGMRAQAADTRFMFARLYTNASIQVAQNLGNQMLDAAIGHLTDSESDYDAMRREFTAGDSVLEIQRGKRALIEKSQRIYELALEILCLFRPDPVEAWNWAQRAKARALSDVLGLSSVPPTRIMAELEQHPASFSLLSEERELADRINEVASEERKELRRLHETLDVGHRLAQPQSNKPEEPIGLRETLDVGHRLAQSQSNKPEELIGLRKTLDGLWELMKKDPNLSEYLELRTGIALDADDLTSLITTGIGTGNLSVCIDWITVNERLFLFALRPGQSPQLVELPLRLSAVRSFIDTYLTSDAFRSTLRDTPEVLRELDPLIAPLIDISAPEDLLILSPTGLLHALPLHALEVNGSPLLVRNPIVYCPSLSVLRHCLARRRKREEQPTAALFGDPSGDRSEAAKLVLYLEQRFGTKPFIKEAVTRHAFTKAISNCDFMHFQGHAVHKPNEPLDSYLALADSNLSAREIFGLPNLQTELVTLAACESAANVIATGDEPLGLIPAFLYAGTNSVLATLWKVNQTSAAETMRFFYDKLTDTDQTITKAQVLRQAMLTVRDTPGFDSPYHWAPFALYGDWY
jgi:CHAT domain-containing protein/tetratricopeptide (TPR) repeat protein